MGDHHSVLGCFISSQSNAYMTHPPSNVFKEYVSPFANAGDGWWTAAYAWCADHHSSHVESTSHKFSITQGGWWGCKTHAGEILTSATSAICEILFVDLSIAKICSMCHTFPPGITGIQHQIILYFGVQPSFNIMTVVWQLCHHMELDHWLPLHAYNWIFMLFVGPYLST